MPNPRKPSGLKLVEGTFRGDRINPDEPKYDTEIPDPPDILSADALIEWNRITPFLETMGLIAQVNLSTLAQYCQVYARWLVAERAIAKPAKDGGGEVVKDVVFNKSGQQMEVLHKSPWVDISLKCVQECRRLANEFGMTPASAGKVNAKPKTPKEKKGQERFFK